MKSAFAHNKADLNILNYTIKIAFCVYFFKKNNPHSQNFSFSSHKQILQELINKNSKEYLLIMTIKNEKKC